MAACFAGFIPDERSQGVAGFAGASNSPGFCRDILKYNNEFMKSLAF